MTRFDAAAGDNNDDNGDVGGEKQQSAGRGRGGGRLQVQKEAVAAVKKLGRLSHTTISHKVGGTRWKRWCWGKDLRMMMGRNDNSTGQMTTGQAL